MNEAKKILADLLPHFSSELIHKWLIHARAFDDVISKGGNPNHYLCAHHSKYDHPCDLLVQLMTTHYNELRAGKIPSVEVYGWVLRALLVLRVPFNLKPQKHYVYSDKRYRKAHGILYLNQIPQEFCESFLFLAFHRCPPVAFALLDLHENYGFLLKPDYLHYQLDLGNTDNTNLTIRLLERSSYLGPRIIANTESTWIDHLLYRHACSCNANSQTHENVKRILKVAFGETIARNDGTGFIPSLRPPYSAIEERWFHSHRDCPRDNLDDMKRMESLMRFTDDLARAAQERICTYMHSVLTELNAPTLCFPYPIVSLIADYALASRFPPDGASAAAVLRNG